MRKQVLEKKIQGKIFNIVLEKIWHCLFKQIFELNYYEDYQKSSLTAFDHEVFQLQNYYGHLMKVYACMI